MRPSPLGPSVGLDFHDLVQGLDQLGVGLFQGLQVYDAPFRLLGGFRGGNAELFGVGLEQGVGHVIDPAAGRRGRNGKNGERAYTSYIHKTCQQLCAEYSYASSLDCQLSDMVVLFLVRNTYVCTLS